eukprot:SAG31_NODE_821_length_11784_cov_62.658194_3_plen_74_part_00
MVSPVWTRAILNLGLGRVPASACQDRSVLFAQLRICDFKGKSSVVVVTSNLDLQVVVVIVISMTTSLLQLQYV